MSRLTRQFSEVITFTRAAPATRVNPAGQNETVAANIPRIDYDATTHACRGLLLSAQDGDQATIDLDRIRTSDQYAWVISGSIADASILGSPIISGDGTFVLVQDGATQNLYSADGLLSSRSHAAPTGNLQINRFGTSRLRTIKFLPALIGQAVAQGICSGQITEADLSLTIDSQPLLIDGQKLNFIEI